MARKSSPRSASVTETPVAPAVSPETTQATATVETPAAPPATVATDGTVQAPAPEVKTPTVCPLPPAIPADTDAGEVERNGSIDALYSEIAALVANHKDASANALNDYASLFAKCDDLHAKGPNFDAYDNTHGKTTEAKTARKPWLNYLTQRNAKLKGAKSRLANFFTSVFPSDERVKMTQSKTGILTATVTKVAKVKPSHKFTPRTLR